MSVTFLTDEDKVLIDASIKNNADGIAELTEELADKHAGWILLDELTIPAGDNTKYYFGVEIDRSYHYEIVLEHTGNAEGWFTIQPQSGGTGDEHNSSNNAIKLLQPGDTMTLVEAYTPAIVLRRPVYVWSQNGQSCTARIYRYEDKYVETMKNRFNTFIVDANGTGFGIYNDLYAALYKLKERYDASTPCTILIRKGEYTLDASKATEETRWSVLWTGQRDISFIGEDREHTIISMTNDVGYSARIFDITGKCKIANLTIKNLMGEGWDGPRSHNPYVIHNDGVYAADAPYDTVVENCHVYSEMFTPVGAGLQNYQRQVYKDCTFEFVGTDSNLSQWGALYIHGPGDTTAANCSVLVDNCTMISRNGTKAMVLPDVEGSLQYTDIPVTIRRCIGYTNGATVTDVNKERCAITEDSALNNIDDWNY